MAEVTTIARPYAEAIYKLAVKKQSLDAWSETLQYLAAVASDERISTLDGDPSISIKQLSDLFISICNNELNDESRNFILLMIENGRVGILPQVSESFERLKAQHEGVLDAKIVSAFALNDGQLSNLMASLEKSLNAS